MSFEDVLEKHFGWKDFRKPQKEVIERALNGQSQLVVMPTGGGKSLCYQFPSLIVDGLVLVISPLIALMKDQVDQALKNSLRATFINSSLSTEVRKKRYERLKKGEFKLLYVTPERFRKSEFLEALSTQEISLMAVDEAHCISQWGQDFRPEYSRLGEIRRELGRPPFLALTATATPEVQKDIVDQLSGEGENVEVCISGLERSNLFLSVHDLYGQDQKIQQILAMYHAYPGPAIVYSSLISTLRELSEQVQKLGVVTYLYHGQMSSKERNAQQSAFFSADKGIMFATPAFGLGIDKSNIRLILHAEPPGSLEAYYQEVGRAGRDGKDSHCQLMYDSDDLSIQMDFIKWSTPEASFIRKTYHLIERHEDRLRQEGFDFLRGELLFYHRRDFRLETAVNMLERWEVIQQVDPRRPEAFRVVGALPEELLDEKQFEARRHHMNQKLFQFLEWIQSQEGCRLLSIYKYFGVQEGKVCGQCDLCLGSLKEN